MTKLNLFLLSLLATAASVLLPRADSGVHLAFIQFLVPAIMAGFTALASAAGNSEAEAAARGEAERNREHQAKLAKEQLAAQQKMAARDRASAAASTAASVASSRGQIAQELARRQVGAAQSTSNDIAKTFFR